MNTNNKHKILIIQSRNKENSPLINLLKSAEFETIIANTIEISIQKVSFNSLDLIICDNNFDNYNGLNIFKLLKPHLVNNGIPFFLYSEKFEIEDILIGLEMGIDNFIFFPVDYNTVIGKIKNQLRKRREMNIFKTDGFKNYFYSSSVAMLFAVNSRIELANDSFLQLINKDKKEVIQKEIDDLFEIAANQQNDLVYRKFINGVSESCNLRKVKAGIHSSLSFDISLYRGNNFGLVTYFVEIMPSAISDLIKNDLNNELEKLTEFNLQKTACDRDTEEPELHLTAREKEIIKLSAKGQPVKIIADNLNLSKRTVEKHRSNIMGKTGTNNIIEAILVINKLGYSTLAYNNY